MIHVESVVCGLVTAHQSHHAIIYIGNKRVIKDAINIYYILEVSDNKKLTFDKH
jgi:hypothetical protein